MQATLSEVEKAKVIEQVDGYRVCEPLYEAVRIVLTSRGETCSPQYVQGISGAAFRVAGICPCAPTCGGTMAATDLLKILGYDVQVMTTEGSGVSYQEMEQLGQAMGNGQPPTAGPATEIYRKARPALEGMLEKIHGELRAGRAVVVWHAFTNAENDVVVGYDDAKGEWIGRGSYVGSQGDYSRAKQMRMFASAAIGGLPSVLVIGAKSRAYDAEAARAAELAALREAVRHATGYAEPGQGQRREVGDALWDRGV